MVQGGWVGSGAPNRHAMSCTVEEDREDPGTAAGDQGESATTLHGQHHPGTCLSCRCFLEKHLSNASVLRYENSLDQPARDSMMARNTAPAPIPP